MWKEVSAQLDALSSWHYKPKPAAPSLSVVADVAAVSMEDAQPATAQGVAGGESTMAPQEVYRAGKATAELGEVVTKAGLPVARQEMTREEKLRRRRRTKERTRKSGGDGKAVSKAAAARKETIAGLKKGGVKVINRKGEIVDMEGRKAVAAKPVSSGSYKL
jgi:U3 small nucleolar RNA-associated protein MPP10